MPKTEQQSELIERYETLRAQLHELEAQEELLDAEVSQIESQLPDNYIYPEDEALVPKRPK